MHIEIFSVVVVVGISGVSSREVDENSGSVEICLTYDHASRRPFSVNLTTSEGTATGEISVLEVLALG